MTPRMTLSEVVLCSANPCACDERGVPCRAHTCQCRARGVLTIAGFGATPACLYVDSRGGRRISAGDATGERGVLRPRDFDSEPMQRAILRLFDDALAAQRVAA